MTYLNMTTVLQVESSLSSVGKWTCFCSSGKLESTLKSTSPENKNMFLFSNMIRLHDECGLPCSCTSNSWEFSLSHHVQTSSGPIRYQVVMVKSTSSKERIKNCGVRFYSFKGISGKCDII